MWTYYLKLRLSDIVAEVSIARSQLVNKARQFESDIAMECKIFGMKLLWKFNVNN